MRSHFRLMCALLAALSLASSFYTSRASAGPQFTVNDAGDTHDASPGNGACADANGKCTPRAGSEEATAVGGNDTITFSVTGSINLTSALPVIHTNISIVGPGASSLTVRRDTGGDYRIFFFQGAINTVSGLTLSNGKTADAAPDFQFAPDGGGAILNGANLTLTDVVVSGNSTGNGAVPKNNSFGGSGGDGGGILNVGSLTMTNVTVSNNHTGAGAPGGVGGWGDRER